MKMVFMVLYPFCGYKGPVAGGGKCSRSGIRCSQVGMVFDIFAGCVGEKSIVDLSFV